MINKEQKTIVASSWESLKIHTKARIAIGRCGNSIPTQELLAFKLAHAKAIDAVHVPFQKELVIRELEEISGAEVLSLQSNAKDRSEYLQRPDLGRTLSEASAQLIKTTQKAAKYDIALIVADGLSSVAIEKNISSMLNLLLPELKSRNYSLAPICVIEQSRVAIADSVAELLNARLSIIFIGERPGLMSPDSLGIYMTYDPKSGTTDERRNCISNVRHDGLSYAAACSKLLYLVDESFKRKISGVHLKDEQDSQLTSSEISYVLNT
jgi:ethanolamine ammonia-lyase small subunit